MVARLDPIKDQATLIRAFAQVVKEHPRAELWLVGDGTRAAELCELAAAEGVADGVVFWGPRSDVPELLGQMDVFAFSTSRDEGFGIALIEAMAAGLPVVASDVPACREVLGSGAAGVLVPPGDPASPRRGDLRLAGLGASKNGMGRPGPGAGDRALRRRRLRQDLVRDIAERAGGACLRSRAS